MKIYLRLIFLLTLLSSLQSHAQVQKGNNSWRLGNRIVNFTADTAMLHEHVNSDVEKLIYIWLDANTDKAKLAANDLYLQDYLGDGIFSVIVSQKSKLSSLEYFQWAEVNYTDKLSSGLSLAPQIDGKIDVIIAVKKGLNQQLLETYIERIGGTLAKEQKWQQQDVWEISLPEEKLMQLASSNWVRYINPKLTDATMNDQAMGYTNAAAARSPIAIGGHNLRGTGVTVGVGDNSDPHHVDYEDRLLSFNPRLQTNHGVHTTGTVGGAGLKDQRYTGFAPDASLISHYFSGIFAYAPTLHRDYGMVVTNNSYGAILGNCAYAGTYDVYAQFLDQQAREYPELLNIFAAGNDGEKLCTPYALGYATVAGAYQSSKNVLTVGSVSKSILISSAFSSKGPVKDGRLKPEISAVGRSIVSTDFNNNYFAETGTSMACPNVAGAATLLYQRYNQMHTANPEAALVKLLLMNGATDIYNPGPDYIGGFGMMNIGHSLTMMDSNRYFRNTINTGGEQTFTFTIPANIAQAKVMLYWNDADASPAASAALVNDLDLTVTKPDASITRPLILNSDIASVALPAIEGEDHLNNVEQVTLNNPAAGSYTITVKGNTVPIADQKYYVAYDFVPVGVQMHYPFGGETLAAGDSTYIYWEASAATNTFTASYSIDNGTSWTIINNNIPDSIREIMWNIPADISSAQCLVRVQRNSTTQQSGSSVFTINARPVATLAPTAEQCPGSVKMNWTSVAGATSYKVFLKESGAMVEKATLPASQTSYQFHGLSTTDEAWVSVAPIIGGKTGMRAVAVTRIPNDGNCVGIDIAGDIALDKIIAPVSGRQLTSTQLSAAEQIIVRLRNGDDDAATNYSIAYQLNDGAWTTQTFTAAIPAAGTTTLTLGTPVDLSAAGVYNLKVAVTNISTVDGVSANDTLTTIIKSIDNSAIDLTEDYLETFEQTTALNKIANDFGIDSAHAWDFTQSGIYGRIKGFVMSDVTIEGNGSISMDNARNQRYNLAASSQNTLTGTFNLSEYDIADIETRCEFDYRLHGVPKFLSNNEVWIRGSDADAWIPAFTFDTTEIGSVKHTASISFNDFFLANSQTFSTSTQVQIRQRDTSLIAASDYGNGLTMDNFRIYRVTNDVELLAVDSIYKQSCALSAETPLQIKVRNTVFYPLYNIAVYYQLDDAPVVAGVIDSIAGKDTFEYRFDVPMDLSALGDHNLSVWINLPDDSYFRNDSILNTNIYNQPIISSFPYLENFETSDGYFYTRGNNTSWEYGTPSSPAIGYAASGTKAWKTNLDGNYNGSEGSFLYSPCFDISTLANPMLSFSLATDIEPLDSTTVFDRAWVEYSNDGNNWRKLGSHSTGYNWYNDTINVWAGRDGQYWHVATTAIPKDDAIVMFRIVLNSDTGAEFEGVAVDDIHIYDRVYPLLNETESSAIVTSNISAADSASFIDDGNILAAINNPGAALSGVSVQAFHQDKLTTYDELQYLLPYSFAVKSTTTPQNVTLKLYVPDTAIKAVRDDMTCMSCPDTRSVYRLGITQYSNADKDLENGSLADNAGGVYAFIKPTDVTWVPYDIGYYAMINVSSFSEFWFNDGGPTGTQALNQSSLDFTATHAGARSAQINWTSYIDTGVVKYELERAADDRVFTKLNEFASLGAVGSSYSYLDYPPITGPLNYYRLHYQLKDGRWLYSPTRIVNWEGVAGDVKVYPNPVRNGIVTLDWFKGNDKPLFWVLTDISGRAMRNGEIADNPYAGTHTFNIGEMGFAAGIYILKVISDGETWEFKIVYQ